MNLKILSLLLTQLLMVPVLLAASPMYSPDWGFYLDLPEGYELVEGNNVDRFSFQGPFEAKIDLAVYQNGYRNIEEMSADVKRRLGSTGDTAFFAYRDKAAALMELTFRGLRGWGLCVELSNTVLLLALAYAPEGQNDLSSFHLSALDSIAPSERERRYPGPVTEFSYPRGEYRETRLVGTGVRARIREHDAEAAQALVERELVVMRHYQTAENWREAWVRYYRAIYRDSWDRVADALQRLEWELNGGAGGRAFAEKALAYVQDFQYQRDMRGSDFVNMVSAVTEGRGDCDTRAMLYAMLLRQAGIPAAMMVSRDYSHAMGLVDIAGAGARFEAEGVSWLVAETTKKVEIGLIGQDMSKIEYWLAITFD